MEQINTGDRVILHNFGHHRGSGQNWAIDSGLSIGEVRTVQEVRGEFLLVDTPSGSRLYIHRENFIKTLTTRFEEGEIISPPDLHIQSLLSAGRNTGEDWAVDVPHVQARVATEIPVDPSLFRPAALSKYKVTPKMEGYGIKYS